ncbi:MULTISPECIES: hypothetical protein [unclassified Chryseobacterium]|nr:MULTISPECIES: hypothetical protein [unclassified Chryseobacterium]
MINVKVKDEVEGFRIFKNTVMAERFDLKSLRCTTTKGFIQIDDL